MTPPPVAASRAAPSRRPAERPGVERRRPSGVPARPRRVSGPARGPVRARPPRGRRSATTGAALGLIAALERVSPRGLLDRLSDRRARPRATADTVGRAWIGFVAFALIGIVTLQLGLLKLNAGIGRALEHAALLQRENAALSVEDSELAATPRVQERAARIGMEIAPLNAIRFLNAGSRGDAARGAAALSTPAPGATLGPGEATANTPGGAAASATSSPSAPAAASGTAERPAASETPWGSPASSAAGAPSTSTAGRPSSERASGTSESGGGSASAPAAPAQAGAGSAETAPGGGTGPGPSE